MKTKVFVITGFLGSGKTTLVKQILNSTEDLSKTVVLVNEFGKVGVDGDLIKQTAAADIVELTSGCICCSLKTDMIQALKMLRSEYTPEKILIEATGVADPASITEVIRGRLLSNEFKLEKVITVLDSDFWEARESFGTVFNSQMVNAHVILLNKIDLVESDQVPVILREIKEIAGNAQVLPTLECRIDPDFFWSDQKYETAKHQEESLFQAYNPANDAFSALNTGSSGSAENQGFTTFLFETEKALDETGLNSFLESLPLEMFRIKGPVKFIDQSKMLNFVGGKASWQTWRETDHTRLAFIGWEVEKEEMLGKIQSCLV